mmetsp:Transcript_10932/g.18529  ORF Transcript_10932/g.18529 Transcript_10932/m.18529 type:complete len:98 (-) Transcript_10932:972-1265(-)
MPRKVTTGSTFCARSGRTRCDGTDRGATLRCWRIIGGDGYRAVPFLSTGVDGVLGGDGVLGVDGGDREFQNTESCGSASEPTKLLFGVATCKDSAPM